MVPPQCLLDVPYRQGLSPLCAHCKGTRVLPACICVYYIQIWCLREPEESVRFLRLVLKMVVSYHMVGSQNQTHVTWKSNQCSGPLSHLLSAPISKSLNLCFFIVESGFCLRVLSFVATLLRFEVRVGGNVVRATEYMYMSVNTLLSLSVFYSFLCWNPGVHVSISSLTHIGTDSAST